MSFNQSFGDCINITVSVPRSSFYQGSPDVNGNTQVVPGNDFTNSSFEDMVVPDNQFDAVETESFYDDFFGCMKTPDNRAKTQTYRLSSAGELRRLKKAATERKADDSFKKRSPWRLIIEEEDIVTSSPVFKKPQSCFNNNYIKKDTDGFFKFLAKAGWRGGILAGQEYLDDLYEIARSRNDPMLLESLESFLAATIDNLLQKQSDNEKLDHALKTATEKNSEIANQLEQEMEQQVAMLEEKIRQEEQRKLDQQKEEANRQILSAQYELLEMEKKVKELEEKVESKANEVNVPDEIIDEIKRKEKENEMLQKKLLEFQTQMALMRTQVAEMKSEYDSQSERLMNERGTVLGCVQEQENLTRQLHLLHEANKKLHDTNDDLRSALDSRKYNSFMEPSISPIKRSTSAGVSMRRPKDSFSSFRSDPGRPFSANSSVNDFDDTDEDSRSILPHDEEINEASLLTELMAVGDHRFDTSVIGSRHENLSYAPDASYLENSNSDREHFVKQLDVLCETNKRLGESNDELRQALSILSGQLKADHEWKQTIVSNGIQSAPVTPIRAQSVTSSYQERPQSTSSPRRVLLTKSGHHSLSQSRSMPDLSTSFDDNADDETTQASTTQAESTTQVESTVFNETMCTCENNIPEEGFSMCDDCLHEDLVTFDESFSLNSAPSHTIYSEAAENSKPCSCDKIQTCDMCTQVNDASLNPVKLDKSIQCEVEEELEPKVTELNASNKNNHIREEGKCQCDVEETENPMEKSTQISDLQLFQTMEDIRVPFQTHDEERSPPQICGKCQTEIKHHQTGIDVCLCNNNHDDSINQLPESTLLTDSDSNNYSDQETTQPSFSKRVKPIGEDSDQDATYETNYGLTVDDSNDMSTWMSDINSSFSLLQNIESELSMYAQRQPDEEIDEDDMDDEELVRLVDKTNEEDLSVSVSEDPITVEEKILEPRGPAVGADTSTESMSSATSDMGSRDQMFKIVLAGNAAVGKSSFIIRLCKDKFYSALNSTLGVDYQVKKMNVGNDSITLQLWDTAGQERFRSIAKSYFRRVDGVVLLYDVTCENSFLDVRDWLESIESSASRRIPVIICGNKVDLRPGAEKCGMPVISTEQGRKLALSVGAMFIECSAKDGTNIEKACRDLTKQLQAAEDEYLREPGITLDEETQPKKKTGCCRS
ncbi:uncharacterized protein LOC130628584 isoform X3 [Hydractinia symbiolongicarpus]|uniref:uncharacterized protein LOC130628584 isoform X3 n=1 Tax=Hydractinia symbiolongicarpus TaxID=13093 RepID=UPI00254BC0D0|nr:uncharacterized protein LOC130628584 isoform X3 [Hydractinia symbiolongicarpus]